MKFSAANAAPAPRTMQLGRDAFADTWGEKPMVDVTVGLRLIAEADIQAARAEASKQAIQWYEGRDGECIDAAARDEAFNDALIRWAVARGTCDPLNRAQPFFELAEDTVRVALTSEGVRRIWDELVRLHVGTGINFAPADDGELRRLAGILEHGAVAALPAGKQAEVRKLLGYCLEQLIPFDTSDEAGEEDVSTYIVSGE